ncbi:hypothetical protein EJB05_17647, partial [Eragrostis curvula]
MGDLIEYHPRVVSNQSESFRLASAHPEEYIKAKADEFLSGLHCSDERLSDFDSEVGKLDGPAVSSRCAVRSLHEVVSAFDERKKKLVKSIGFGGLLNFPYLKQINRRFSVWLMSKVDVSSISIVIDSSRIIRFGKEDVSLVFGIPCRGRTVTKRGCLKKDRKQASNDGLCNSRLMELRSIKSCQEVLERSYTDVMTKEEEDVFKAAFVVFAMSTLLAPGTKHDYASGDYWDALKDPSAIKLYD